MRDLYLSDILEDEVYETFDGRALYISKKGEHHCVVYEKPRGTNQPWEWNLRTVSYLRRNIRTIIEMEV